MFLWNNVKELFLLKTSIQIFSKFGLEKKKTIYNRIRWSLHYILTHESKFHLRHHACHNNKN